jgi:DNA-binding transcriptional ArsR family regulator
MTLTATIQMIRDTADLLGGPGALRAAVDGHEQVAQLLGAVGSVAELRELVDLLFPPTGAVYAVSAGPKRERSTPAEMEALQKLVLERAQSLGREFSAAEIACQIERDHVSVSNELRKLVDAGVLISTGEKRSKRYSVKVLAG